MSWPPQRCGAGVAQSEAAVLLSAAKSATRSTVEDPVIEKETRSQDDIDLPWQVVVHNDPVNLMTYVSMVFQRVFCYAREKAERQVLEVDQNGRSVLASGRSER